MNAFSKYTQNSKNELEKKLSSFSLNEDKKKEYLSEFSRMEDGQKKLKMLFTAKKSKKNINEYVDILLSNNTPTTIREKKLSVLQRFRENFFPEKLSQAEFSKNQTLINVRKKALQEEIAVIEKKQTELEKELSHLKISVKEAEKIFYLANFLTIEEAKDFVEKLSRNKERATKELDIYFANLRAEDAEQERKIAEILASVKKESVENKNSEFIQIFKDALELRLQGNELPEETRIKVEYLQTIENFLQSKKELISEMNILHQELIALNRSFEKNEPTPEDLLKIEPLLKEKIAKAENISNGFDDEISNRAFAHHRKLKANPQALNAILADSRGKVSFAQMDDIPNILESIGKEMYKASLKVTQLSQKQKYGEPKKAEQTQAQKNISENSLKIKDKGNSHNPTLPASVFKVNQKENERTAIASPAA